jgi:hypothetical protein
VISLRYPQRIGGLRIAVVIGVDDPRSPDQPLRHTKVVLYFAVLSCPHDELIDGVRWLKGEKSGRADSKHSRIRPKLVQPSPFEPDSRCLESVRGKCI